MSIENSIKRNKKESSSIFDDRRIAPFTKEQARITQEWILPYAEAIVSDAQDIRKKVDRVLEKDPEVKEQLRLHNESYPLGRCNEIVQKFSELMKGELLNRDYDGMQAVKNFVRGGGLIQPFWGIDKDMYFQNAIQLGTSLLDVANDTVDRSKPSVVLYPDMRETPLKNIDTITQFADIAENYWKVDLYPNIYMPWLAPVYPMLAVHKRRSAKENKDVLMLETQTEHLMFRNMHDIRDDHLYGLSSEFMFNSPYSEKRLPSDLVEKLFSSKKDKWWDTNSRRRPDIFKLSTDPADAREAINRFYLPKDATELPKDYMHDSRTIYLTGRAFNRYRIAEVGR